MAPTLSIGKAEQSEKGPEKSNKNDSVNKGIDVCEKISRDIYLTGLGDS